MKNHATGGQIGGQNGMLDMQKLPEHCCPRLPNAEYRGSLTRIRTWNLLINSQPLYR